MVYSSWTEKLVENIRAHRAGGHRGFLLGGGLSSVLLISISRLALSRDGKICLILSSGRWFILCRVKNSACRVKKSALFKCYFFNVFEDGELCSQSGVI